MTIDTASAALALVPASAPTPASRTIDRASSLPSVST